MGWWVLTQHLPVSFINGVLFLSSRSVVSNFLRPQGVQHTASLSFTLSQSWLRLMSIESVMPSNHLILCRPLLLLPSILPKSSGSFPMELALCIRWPTYWSFTAVSVAHMERLLVYFWISSLGKGIFSSHILLF